VNQEPAIGEAGAMPFQQGHLASLQDGLDFINTLEYDRDQVTDELVSAEAALDWLVRHGLMHREARDHVVRHFADAPSESSRILTKMKRVRAAMREIVDATVEGRAAAASDMKELNRALRTHYVYELVPASDGVSLDHRHQGDPVDGALARLSESIARELIQGHPDRLRICENDQCRYIFADTSRTGRRKWCDMSTCGNRAKVARHRARQKAAAN
jgi:predicted RNA-binding Zn ribbon-like protein